MRNRIQIDLYCAFIGIQKYAARQFYDNGTPEHLRPFLEAMELFEALRYGGAKRIADNFEEMADCGDVDWNKFEGVVACNMTETFKWRREDD